MGKLIFEFFLLKDKSLVLSYKIQKICASHFYIMINRDCDHFCTVLWIKQMRLLAVENNGYGSPDSLASHLAGSRDNRINLLAICNPFRNIRIQKLGNS